MGDGGTGDGLSGDGGKWRWVKWGCGKYGWKKEVRVGTVVQRTQRYHTILNNGCT